MEDGLWEMEGTQVRLKVSLEFVCFLCHLKWSHSGVMYSETPSDCPTGLNDWKYLDEDLGWRDNGKITLTCSAK